MTVFINGKQKRFKRLPTIGGKDMDEFMERHADPKLWSGLFGQLEAFYKW